MTVMPTRERHTRCRRLVPVAACLVAVLVLLSGPGATFLQHRGRTADPTRPWDAVYLVCGARAQHRRLAAMKQWLEATPSLPPRLLVGNDTQKSLWSREHQRNLTRAEWGMQALEQWAAGQGEHAATLRVERLPGDFNNTDGEMQALADALAERPDIRRLALVTSRFHARRALQRLEARAPAHLTAIALVPGIPHWENRAPWIVAGEYLKLLRDATGLSQAPLLSRPTSPLSPPP